MAGLSALLFGSVGVSIGSSGAVITTTTGLLGAGGSFAGLGVGGVTAAGVSTATAGTLAAATTITGVLGTGLAVYSANKQGEAAVIRAKGDKAIAAANANIAKRRAKDIRNRTSFEQRLLAKRQSQRASALQARLGISGAITTTGAALELQVEQENISELDQLILGFEGRAREQQAIAQQGIFQMESRIAGANIAAAKESRILGPTTEFVKGAGGIALRSAKLKTALNR